MIAFEVDSRLAYVGAAAGAATAPERAEAQKHEARREGEAAYSAKRVQLAQRSGPICEEVSSRKHRGGRGSS